MKTIKPEMMVIMSPRSRWQDVRDALREQITTGVFKPGTRIPTELELVDTYGYSRPTVSKALKALELEGLVTAAVAGVGREVRSRDHFTTWDLTKFAPDTPDGIAQWEADAHSRGWTTRQSLVGLSELDATAEVARHLQCAPGERLLRRRLLTYVQRESLPEQLVFIADTWIPLDIANTEIDGKAPLRGTTTLDRSGAIYRALGYAQVRFHDEISARMATLEESELLNQQPGTAVGQHARVGIDSTGRGVRVQISVFSGDALRLSYDLPAPDIDASQD